MEVSEISNMICAANSWDICQQYPAIKHVIKTKALSSEKFPNIPFIQKQSFDQPVMFIFEILTDPDLTHQKQETEIIASYLPCNKSKKIF